MGILFCVLIFVVVSTLPAKEIKNRMNIAFHAAKYFDSTFIVATPTPKFFKKLRNIGLVLAAIAGTIVAAPVALPVVIVKVAGYLAVASGVLSAVSQTAVEGE